MKEIVSSLSKLKNAKDYNHPLGRCLVVSILHNSLLFLLLQFLSVSVVVVVVVLLLLTIIIIVEEIMR